MTDGGYGPKSSALGTVGEPLLCLLYAQRWGETQILNVYPHSLCLKLTFPPPFCSFLQMNSDMNLLGGWRQRDTLSRNGAQTIVSTSNLQVISTLISTDH